MIIFPAIDIMDGKCVRLTKGVFDNPTVYSDEPDEMAKLWKGEGAEYLHVVDLDGAREGKPINTGCIAKILRTGLKVEVGGGIRKKEDIDKLINIGVYRVILGTSALDESFLKDMVSLYGEKIVVGIDSKDRKVAVKGWLQESDIMDTDMARRVKDIGVSTVIYTDISRDGMLNGPNFDAISEVNETGLNIVASGGVTSIDDIIRLKELGIYGAIIGKALYNGNIDLAKALEVARC